MKTLVTVLMTALCVFALATAWVDYVQPHLEKSARRSTESFEPDVPVATTPRRPRKAAPVASKPVPIPDAPVQIEPTAIAAKPIDSPPPEALNEKLDEVKQEESRLAARQESLRMIYDDIRSELTAIDELRKRTTEDMVDAEMRLLETAQRKSPRSATAGPKAPTRAASENPQDRSQALFIRRLVKEGKLETAVSILKSMKARDAAAILASLDDVDAPLAERLAAALPTDRETIRR